MYSSMSAEEHFSKRSPGPGTASLEAARGSSASSWISMFSSVSTPAWALLQKYLPGRSQAGKANLDVGHQLVPGLDDLLPPGQSPTYAHCLHEHAGFVTAGDAEPLSWLAAGSLSELGIRDAVGTDFKAQHPAPVGYRYLPTTKTFLGQVLALKEGKHAKPVQPKSDVWYTTTTTRATNTWWWWHGFWRFDDPQNALPVLYHTRNSADGETKSPHCGEHHSSGHCELDGYGSAVAVAKPIELLVHSDEAECTRRESAGPSRVKESTGGTSLHTARLEFLLSSDCLPSAQERAIVEDQVSARAATACSEVAVLTPDQDNGYSSLEEESANTRQHNMNAGSEKLLEFDSSAASQAGDHGHGGEDKPAGNPQYEVVENKEVEQKEQNAELTSVNEAFPVPSTSRCQNKTIAYIMGSPCNDESDVEDNSDQDSDDDDDGFDSEVSSDFSDSEDLADSDDEEDEEDSESDELDSESERLWNSLCQTRDPYNPRNFTAPIQTSRKPSAAAMNSSPSGSPAESFLCSSPSSPSSPLGPQEDMESSEDACSSMDEAETLRLWNSFSCSSDPYSPMNFQAPIRTQEPVKGRCKKGAPVGPPLYRKEEAEERMDSGFSEAATFQGLTSAGCVKLKKVTFIEEVEEFYASSDEERRGPWEEFARDRCRFQRRVQEVQESISYCLSPTFRRLIFQRLYPSS